MLSQNMASCDNSFMVTAPCEEPRGGWQSALAVAPQPLVPFPSRYVEDSAAYSAGLLSAAEALPAARQQRDASLKRVLLEPLQARSAGGLPMLNPRPCCRLVLLVALKTQILKSCRQSCRHSWAASPPQPPSCCPAPPR